MDKRKFLETAKNLQLIARELKKIAKEEPQLFESPAKEKIIVLNKKHAQASLEAQDIIAEWAILWNKKYGVPPIIHKNWVYSLAPLLARGTHTKMQLSNALKNYFADDTPYMREKARYGLLFFVQNINRYLVVKTADEREEVYE